MPLQDASSLSLPRPTDAMTDAVMEKVLAALNDQLGAQMRA